MSDFMVELNLCVKLITAPFLCFSFFLEKIALALEIYNSNVLNRGGGYGVGVESRMMVYGEEVKKIFNFNGT